MMTAEKLNARLHELDLELDGQCPPYFGWGWRDVDWEGDHVHLSDGGVDGCPDWYGITFESRFLGQAWEDPGVRFDESQKWGYPRLLIDGEDWTMLKKKVLELASTPTEAKLTELTAFMNAFRGRVTT